MLKIFFISQNHIIITLPNNMILTGILEISLKIIKLVYNIILIIKNLFIHIYQI